MSLPKRSSRVVAVFGLGGMKTPELFTWRIVGRPDRLIITRADGTYERILPMASVLQKVLQ